MQPDQADRILQDLEATEANLAKLDRLWTAIRAMLPDGVAFKIDAEYDELRRQFSDFVAAMPAINGFRLADNTAELNEIAQAHLDANDIGEAELHVRVYEMLEQPGRDLSEYRFRLRKRRREITRDLASLLVSAFDDKLRALVASRPPEIEPNASVPPDGIASIRSVINQLDRVLGSLAERPSRWSDLKRHLHFGLWADIDDIVAMDWPAVRPGIVGTLYGEDDPLPVSVSDLGSLEVLPPDTPIPTELAFEVLDATGFERLIFALLSAEPSYENPQWLMRTNAPDRGRDLSVSRVIVDGLAGTRRERVIVQCKHWRETSVGVAELATLKEQVKLWEPPRVGVLVIATTGRFTADSVLAIEKHNEAGELPRIEMWPDSHLELLLARRVNVLAEFGLRRTV